MAAFPKRGPGDAWGEHVLFFCPSTPQLVETIKAWWWVVICCVVLGGKKLKCTPIWVPRTAFGKPCSMVYSIFIIAKSVSLPWTFFLCLSMLFHSQLNLRWRFLKGRLSSMTSCLQISTTTFKSIKTATIGSSQFAPSPLPTLWRM